jgi:rod shape-determining protein MreD
MIMRPGQPLLLPASSLFIWGSVIAAFVFNMLMNMAVLGRTAAMPDLLAVVLVFWTVHQPQRVNIGAAFVFGLFMDVHQTSVLGLHALSYTVLSFLAVSIHRRLLWFTVPSQTLHVLPLFVAAHVLDLLVRLLTGSAWPGWTLLLAPLLESLLWPVVSVLLLLPQRRPPDPDANRPL